MLYISVMNCIIVQLFIRKCDLIKMCLTFWGGEAVSRMRIRLNALVTLSHGKGFTLFPFYRVSFRVLYCAYIIIKLAATGFQLVALCTSLNLEWSRNKQVLLVDIKYWLRLHLFKLGSSISLRFYNYSILTTWQLSREMTRATSLVWNEFTSAAFILVPFGTSNLNKKQSEIQLKEDWVNVNVNEIPGDHQDGR